MRGNAESDHELMRRCALNEEAAFEELVRRYQQPIVDYLWRLLGSPSRAEELGQEVFLRVFRHRDTYTQDAGFSTWCYAIATNLARDERRARRRRPASAGSEPLEGLQAQGRDPSAPLELRELRELVHKALERIPDPYREALALRDLQGCSYQEIARTLDMEIGTVKSRINRARLAFKDAFAALGGVTAEEMEEA